MGLETTIMVVAVAAVLAVWGLVGVRRKRPLGDVSLVPHHAFLFVGLTLLILAGAHLIALLTGVPLPGRMGR